MFPLEHVGEVSMSVKKQSVGIIANVRLWPTILSDLEIAKLFSEGTVTGHQLSELGPRPRLGKV